MTSTRSGYVALVTMASLAGLLPNDASCADADAASGKIIVDRLKCEECHGRDGNGGLGRYPVLAGQHAHYLVSVMAAYKERLRKNGTMTQACAELSNQDILDVAAYYAAAKWAAVPVNELPGDADTGKQQSQVCASCHGTDGNSTLPHYPKLAGHRAAYLVRAMRSYKYGIRNDAIMRGLVMPLTEDQIRNIASYYSAQPRK